LPNKIAKKSAYLNGGIVSIDNTSGHILGEVEVIPYKLLTDGSRLYNWKVARAATDPLGTQFHDVMIFGRSVLHLNIEEVRVYPSGWGYALVQKLEESDDLITLPDGRELNHYLYGYVEVV
jgi:hypothetical protein